MAPPPTPSAFITGIAGFAGSHLAERLLASGTRVAGLVRGDGPWPNLAAIESSVRLYRGDLLDLDRVAAALASARPATIFHLAGLAAPARSFDDPLAFFRANTLGTATLLEAIARAGIGGSARVVVVSSAEAYGRAAGDGPVAEDAPLRPVSPYGASKAAAEAAATAAFEGRGIAVLVARAFNHTGPRQQPDFAAAAFARQIALAEAGLAPPEVRAGRLDAVRDYAHVEDVVMAYAALGERGRPGRAYNVGSGRGVRISEVLERLIARATVPIRVVEDPARLRPVEIPHLVADPGRLRSEVGVALERPLDEALAALLDDWRRRVRSEQRAAPAEPHHDPG